LKPITIAIDAMGGDFGPEVTVPAALQILRQYENLSLILVGNSELLQAMMTTHHAKEQDRLIIRHASEQVAMDELPSQALRTKKDSSMRVAINLVKEGAAQAAVSAGNTGALMATARFVLKTLPGIDRPAIITTFPTMASENGKHKEVRILDLGANVDSCADNLYQFAVMGSVLVSALDKIERPTVGLLNIGEEEIKGNDLVKQAAQLLSQSHAINYYGYIEGDAILSGTVDVVVCDGFIGNVALKSMEGVAKLINTITREEFKRNWYSRLAGLIALPVFKQLKKRIDPDRHNGASFIGLQGIVIKSHGGANVRAFAQAIHEAIVEVEQNIPQKIGQEVGMLLEDHES
jgi:phosphate acyltransferase